MEIKEIPEIALNFIFQNKNSTFREAIFKNKFKFDFQIAAAHNNEYLFIYERDVDRYGVDLIMEFKGTLRPVQLKTVIRSHRKNSSTKTWTLNPKLLRPQARLSRHCNQLPLRKMRSDGLGGALIVQEIEWAIDDSIKVNYHYFDYTLLDLILDKRIQSSILKDQKKKLRSLGILRDRILSSNDEIKISRGHLMNVEGEIDRILSFMGFETAEANGSIFEYLEWIRSQGPMSGNGMEALQRILSRAKIPDSNF